MPACRGIFTNVDERTCSFILCLWEWIGLGSITSYYNRKYHFLYRRPVHVRKRLDKGQGQDVSVPDPGKCGSVCSESMLSVLRRHFDTAVVLGKKLSCDEGAVYEEADVHLCAPDHRDRLYDQQQRAGRHSPDRGNRTAFRLQSICENTDPA